MRCQLPHSRETFAVELLLLAQLDDAALDVVTLPRKNVCHVNVKSHLIPKGKGQTFKIVNWIHFYFHSNY